MHGWYAALCNRQALFTTLIETLAFGTLREVFIQHRSVCKHPTMASEVSKLIDDELQKEGRDETTRLLPGQGVKARLVRDMHHCVQCSRMRDSADPPIGDGRCPAARGSLECVSFGRGR